MKEDGHTGRRGKGPTPRRWGRAVLCLLFAFGVFFHFGQSVPALAQFGVAQFVNADGAADPCEQGHALGVDHCKSASSCPLCGPVDLNAAVYDYAGSHPSAIADALVLGLVIDPQLRPPRLFLQA
jgi:hypothetical protein